MNVTIACSDERHPVNAWLTRWQSANSRYHDIRIVRRLSDLTGGEILFLVSFHERVDYQVRSRYGAALVLHASDLPKGRGWSPHVWRIIEGKNDIVVTLLEAVDHIDAGPIWAQERVMLEGHELCDEINAALFDAELRLMDLALSRFGQIKPSPQSGEPTYYRRRTPDDSRVDPYASIADQFDLLRVCDPVRYPAFFELRGHRYRLTIEKIGEAKR